MRCHQSYVTPRIIRTLRKSFVRREVLDYLTTIYPGVAYSRQISQAIKLSANHVYGVLMGIKGAYEPDNSLCSQGLAERIEEDGRKEVYYRATELGCLVSRTYRPKLRPGANHGVDRDVIPDNYAF